MPNIFPPENCPLLGVPMPDNHSGGDDVLSALRVAVARLEERIDQKRKAIEDKIDLVVVSREHLELRLAPLFENMNKGKGALAMIIFVAGGLGALVYEFLRHLLM